MRAVIETIKGLTVRCLIENGDLLSVYKKDLPENIKEGDVLRLSLELDIEGTEKQQQLMKDLKNKSNG